MKSRVPMGEPATRMPSWLKAKPTGKRAFVAGVGAGAWGGSKRLHLPVEGEACVFAGPESEVAEDVCVGYVEVLPVVGVVGGGWW